MRAALATLSPAARQLLYLSDALELDYHQVAQVTGLSPEVVAARLHRSRHKLLHALARPARRREGLSRNPHTSCPAR
jgi:DNA-directed RNA polymerase specialized sigma24 family protein